MRRYIPPTGCARRYKCLNTNTEAESTHAAVPGYYNPSGRPGKLGKKGKNPELFGTPFRASPELSKGLLRACPELFGEHFRSPRALGLAARLSSLGSQACRRGGSTGPLVMGPSIHPSSYAVTSVYNI